MICIDFYVCRFNSLHVTYVLGITLANQIVVAIILTLSWSHICCISYAKYFCVLFIFISITMSSFLLLLIFPGINNGLIFNFFIYWIPIIRIWKNSVIIDALVSNFCSFFFCEISFHEARLTVAPTQLCYSISKRNLARHKCGTIKRDVKLTAVYVTLFTWNYRWFLPCPRGKNVHHEIH